jgi:hypothetical protein
MGERQADQAIRRMGTGVKRRGILAAAAVAVAGIMAKQVSQPVAAAPITADYFVANGSGSNGFQTTGVFSSGVNVHGLAYGVYSTGGNGVSASGDLGYGVYGETHAAVSSGYAGVRGVGNGTGTYGVYGDDGGSGGFGGIGVQGVSAYGIGVQGRISGLSSTANTIAVRGLNQGTGANSHGVVGQSATGYGVLGITTNGSASLSGISTNVNIPAFAGGNSAPNGLAASFAGTVYVNGSFVVQDPANKHGAIKHPDGSTRLLYSMESPESWIEDFGKGRLSNGKAEVRLDADFAAVVQTGDYLVFLTERGESNGLYISAQGATVFTVQERGKGTSGAAFYWRVVARPKTDKKAIRLERFTPPEVKLPDPATLPQLSAEPPAPRKP